MNEINCDDYHDQVKANQCDFVLATETCQDNDGLIHYLSFPICVLPNYQWVADIILVLWTCYLFLSLAITAEDFFCPALTAISKMLKLSQNVAGVTFLALGNGAPDIFSCIVALGSGKPETTSLAFGAMFGAGLFVNTVVVGAVTLSQDSYELARRPFLRDCVFYLAAIYWTWYNCYEGKIGLPTAIGYIIMYIAYVLIVILGRYIFQTFLKKKVDMTLLVDENTHYIVQEDGSCIYNQRNMNVNETETGTDEDFNPVQWTTIPGVKDSAIARAAGIAQTMPGNSLGYPGYNRLEDGPATPLLRPDSSIQSEYVTPSDRNEYEYQSYSCAAFQQGLNNFVMAINPIHTADWEEFGIKDKVIDILGVPANLIFTLTIPVVDITAPMNNWNKYLNSLHLVICPLVVCFLLQEFDNSIGHVPIPVIFGLIGLLLSVLVSLTAYQSEPPIYHKPLYSIFGFLMSVIWIYTIANEIVSMLTAFGHMFLIPGAILGVTVLCWANSVGDLVSDVAMSKQGYPQMAVSACIGGPCLNMLLGVGIASTLAIIRTGKALPLDLTGTLKISSGFLMCAISSTLVAIPAMNFKVHRWYGYYLFALYALFMVLALLNVTGAVNIAN